MNRVPRLAAFRKRALVSLFLLAPLLASLVEQHDTGRGASLHDDADAFTSTYFPAAAHPDWPLHVESSPEVAAHHCLACLHSLKHHSTPPRPTADAVRPESRGLAPLVRHADFAAPHTGTRFGRAPPRS
jgi:hypothetical protein